MSDDKCLSGLNFAWKPNQPDPNSGRPAIESVNIP